jgi:hypothetical protein
VLVGHYPLREDLIRTPHIPRFTPWCGTRRTADWHNNRYRAVVAVSGHLHVRRTDTEAADVIDFGFVGFASEARARGAA